MSVSSLLLAAMVATAPAPDPAPVIDAELAFAARAAEVGVAQSFLDFMTDDAIVFAPDPVNAKAFYSARPKGKTPAEGGVLLAWWPNWAGIARSGDLGFTTGPAEVGGKRAVNYFTVWKRQPAGGWKWVYDGGTSDASGGAPKEAPVAHLAPGDPAPRTPQAAMRTVRAAEAALAAKAATDLAGAYRDALTTDARVQGSPLKPATTPAAVSAELATRAPAATFETLGGEASAAGDLAWTYGAVRWTRAGEPGRGHYVRIWQAREGRFRLVFDQIIEVAPPQPKPQG